MMRRFLLEFWMHGNFITSAIIDLHQSVINNVDDEWRQNFYDLYTPEEIAKHIGFDLIINQSSLSRLDGWASFRDDYAKVIELPFLDNWEIEAREMDEDEIGSEP